MILLALLLVASLSAVEFPKHKPRERIGYNTTYTTTCKSGTQTIMTFSTLVAQRSINVLKGSFTDTSHFGMMMAKPSVTTTTTTEANPVPYDILSFSSTAFGGRAANYIFLGSNQKFNCDTAPAGYCLMDFNFVDMQFKASTVNDTPWAKLVTEKVSRHWPRKDGVPWGPPPAERLMVTISITNFTTSVTTAAGTNITPVQLKAAIETNYQGIVSDVQLAPNPPANLDPTKTRCIFTIPMDYDIGWSVWPLVLVTITGVLVTVAISVLKCCPCAAIKRIYYRKGANVLDSTGSFSNEPIAAPSEIDLTEETVRSEKL